MLKRILITGAGGPASINFTESLRIASEKMVLIGIEINQHHRYLARTDKTFLIPKATEKNYIDPC